MSTSYRGILLCMTGAVTWGINGVVSQFLFMNYTVDSSWLTAVRMISAGLILFVIFFPQKREQFKGILCDPVSLRHLLIFSICGLLFCQYAYLTAIKHSNSGTATVLQTLSVVLMAFYLAVRFHKKPSLRENISVILAVLGVYLVATDGNPSAMILSPSGLAWGLISAIGALVYPLLSQGIACRWGAPPVNSLGMIIGGTIFTLAAQIWTLTPDLDAHGWLAIAFIIIVGTVISFSAFIQGIRLIGPMKATLIGTLEPVMASILSALCLGTAFTPIEIIGFVCILTTVFLIIAKKEA